MHATRLQQRRPQPLGREPPGKTPRTPDRPCRQTGAQISWGSRQQGLQAARCNPRGGLVMDVRGSCHRVPPTAGNSLQNSIAAARPRRDLLAMPSRISLISLYMRSQRLWHVGGNEVTTDDRVVGCKHFGHKFPGTAVLHVHSFWIRLLRVGRQGS